MPEFRIDREITSANGTQSYTVQAKNKAAAILLFEKGEGVFIDEDISVDDISSVENSDIYEI